MPATPPSRRTLPACSTALDADGRTPDVVVYNASNRVRGPLVDLPPDDVKRAIEISAFGGFLVSQQAARRMLPKSHGAIFLTGATAGVKGFALSATFAMGKFALRGLAQSMARELSPQGHPCRPFRDRRRHPERRAAGAGQQRPTACSIPTPSPRPTGRRCSSTAAPGAGRSRSGRGSRSSRSCRTAGLESRSASTLSPTEACRGRSASSEVLAQQPQRGVQVGQDVQRTWRGSRAAAAGGRAP